MLSIWEGSGMSPSLARSTSVHRPRQRVLLMTTVPRKTIPADWLQHGNERVKEPLRRQRACPTPPQRRDGRMADWMQGEKMSSYFVIETICC